MNVAIIDDSNLMRERLRELLEEIPGVKILGEAESLISAKKLIKTLGLNLVFMDIRLSDGVSIDFIKTLKQLKPKPIVIILTNYPYDEYHKRCFDYGADYVLEKMNDFEKIPDLVNELIDKDTNYNKSNEI